jgi:hypothetical protein
MKEIVSLWLDDWKSIYRAHPRITVAGTVVGLLLVFGIGFYLPYGDIKNQESLERKRLRIFRITNNLALNNVQGSLNNLIAFVELQKTNTLAHRPIRRPEFFKYDLFGRGI